VDGWKPQVVPHRDITPLISSDDVGPYFAHQPDKIVDAQGAPLSKQAALWLRRSFTLAGPIPPGMRVRLCLDGVAFKHVAMLNDRKLGESVLALAPHIYDVTAGLKTGENHLAIGITNRAGLWDQEHKTYVAPIAGTMAGIYGAVRLELVPETLIADVFVRTSVAKKRLEVDLELSNASNRPRTVQPEIAIRDPMGTVQLTLVGQPVELAPGTLRTVTVGTDWLARHLWGLSQPHLYRAEVRLLENGAERDRTAVTFGYREFAAKGIDFTLNGRRQVLLRNSWLRSDGDDGDGSRIDWMLGYVNDEIRNYNCVRLHLGFNNPHVIAQADRSGLMIIPEFWGYYVTNDKAMPIAQAQFWLPNTAETVRRLVRRWRNHPSVIMWSTGNEMMWDSIAADKMAVADTLVKTIRAADPTRLLQGDAEITWDGRLDAINIHYPEIENGPVSARYPLSGRVIPNDFDWLKPPGERSVAWRSDFVWDRPLMLGEFSSAEDEPELYTSYAGDAVYDHTAWTWNDFDGRGEAANSPWLDMVKMSCDHYRAAGVACLNPWTGFGDQLMPRFLVAPLDHHPNAFSGEDFIRRIVVANDTHQMYHYGNLFVQAGLLIDGREVWSERINEAHCGPGEKKTLAVTVKIPVVEQTKKARLVLRLNWMIGPNPRELHRHEEDLWIHPRPSLADANAGQVALLDVVGGATAKALDGLGMSVAPGPIDDAALDGKRLLVIGEGAAETADLAAAARFVERGGRVLMLHQTALPPFIPGMPMIDTRHAASFSWRHAEHPALAGLDEGQLRFWRPDHLVATETYVRPSVGAGVSAATCGGRYGMRWSPLIEQRYGKGSVTFCQYLLAERTAIEPAAAVILSQAIRAALAAAPMNPAPLLRLLSPSPEMASLLATAHVATTNDLAGAGPVLLDAATPPAADILKRLRTEVEEGRTLWLRGLNEQTLSAVQELLPWKPGFAPLPTNNFGAIRRSQHPLIAGLSTADFFWARGSFPRVSTTPLGGPVIVPPHLDAAVLLTEPALLVAVPLGKGWVLIDQLALSQAMAIETERTLRIVSCLARNIGAGFQLPTDALGHYRFTGLDLAKHANRDYIDEKAGDGGGGWTDQGDNDLRYFLINHAGLVGAGEANEPFPTSMAFHGVEYRLVDPKANHGKAIIVLRAGDHDPAAPATVTGIPADGAKADRVWFLHTGAWPSNGGHGTEIARYEIVYADGTRAVAPVRMGQEITDWWRPKPMPGAQVAWTGRNAQSNVVVVYSMAWNNPHPDKPIASIDVIGNLAQTQLVLLAITLGVDESGARPVASWDLGRFADGKVAADTGEEALVGTGTPALLGQRTGLRLAGGQNLSANLSKDNPLVTGKPVAIEIELAPDGKPGGYCGGLVSAGNYQISGLRLTLGGDLRVCAEQWTGEGAANAVYLKTRESLPTGRFTTLRYEHNGVESRLLFDGQVQAIQSCAPLAPYADVVMCIGRTGGKDYWFNGVIGAVRIFALAPASEKP
jgi:beta-galactosidase